MLHLIKLCVGCESVKDLEDWIKERLKANKAAAPKRARASASAITPPAWCRSAPRKSHRRLALLGDPRPDHVPRAHPRHPPVRRQGGLGRCHIVLDCKPVLVEPRPYRAFQGWRYLDVKDAPRDLDRAAPGARNMPEAMRRELRDLGLL